MQRILKNASCIVFFTLVIFIYSINTYSAQVTLIWDPNSENDLAGYTLYYGIATASYDNSIDIGNVTNYTATNLTENETYFFAVTAYDTSLNESDYSIEVDYTVPNTTPPTDTTPPSVPDSLTATAISDSQINITWNASTDDVAVAGYKIFRDSIEIAVTSNTSYQDNGLTPSTSYSYSVSAFDAEGNESIKSLESSATTQSAPNNPPVLDPIADIIVDEGDTVVLSPTANDPDGDTLSFTYSGWMTTDSKTTNYDDAGIYTVTITVSDGSLTDSQDITVTVNDIDPGLVISNLSVSSEKLYQIITDGLKKDALVYIDKKNKFTNIPTSILGTTYIKTANSDKGKKGDLFLSFDVNQNVTVYLAHDDHITPKPSWMASFVDSGENLVTTDTTLSLYKKDFLSGTVALGGNDGKGKSNMYSVIITSQIAGTIIDTNLSEATTYTYSVTAFDASGNESIESNLIYISTLSDDNIPPTITSVTMNGSPTEVTVVYSEPVETLSATNVSNYFIDNGISILSASISEDLITVTLSTTQHSEGVLYTLQIINVEDLATIPNVIDLSTSATYNYIKHKTSVSHSK